MRWLPALLLLVGVGACRSGGQVIRKHGKEEGANLFRKEESEKGLPPTLVALRRLRREIDRYGFQIAWHYDFREKIRNLYYVPMKNSLHRLYLETENNVLYRLDPRGGKVIWQCTFNGPLAFAPVSFDYGDVERRKAIEERLERLGVTEIEEAKRLTTELGRFPPECVAVVGSTVYCIDDSSGKILWKKTLAFDLACRPMVGFNDVYVVNWQHRLYALRKKDGVLEWDILLDSDAMGGGACKGAHVFIGDVSGKVYCIDGASGDIVWTFRTLDRIVAPPNVWYLKMYVGSCDGFLYSINAEGGFETWKFACQWPIVDEPIAIGYVIYAIAEKKGRRMIFAVDRKANLLWRQRNCIKVLLQGRSWRGRTQSYILDASGNICAVLTLSPIKGEIGEVRWRLPAYSYGFEFFVTNPSDRRCIRKNIARRCIYMATKFGLVVAIEEMPHF